MPTGVRTPVEGGRMYPAEGGRYDAAGEDVRMEGGRMPPGDPG